MTDSLNIDVNDGAMHVLHKHHQPTSLSSESADGSEHEKHHHYYITDHHNYKTQKQQNIQEKNHMDAALAALLSKEGHSGDKGMLGGMGGILIGLLLGRTGLLGGVVDGVGRVGGVDTGRETRIELNNDVNSLETAINMLTQDVGGVSRDVLQSACNTQATITAEGRNIDNRICNTDGLIAASQTALTNLLYQNTIDNNQQLAGINLAVATTAANAAADRAAIAARLSTEITNASFAAERSASATQLLVEREAAATRQLIEANRASDLQAKVIELQNALNESRGDRRARESEITITQTVNQNQLQLQAQAQAQQVNTAILSALQTLIQENQINRATNAVYQIGTSGIASTSGLTNTATNVR